MKSKDEGGIHNVTAYEKTLMVWNNPRKKKEKYGEVVAEVNFVNHQDHDLSSDSLSQASRERYSPGQMKVIFIEGSTFILNFKTHLDESSDECQANSMRSKNPYSLTSLKASSNNSCLIQLKPNRISRVNESAEIKEGSMILGDKEGGMGRGSFSSKDNSLVVGS